MATDFKYASQSDLSYYYPSYVNFNTRRQLLGWSTSNNLHQAHGVGLVNILFVNSDEVTASENTDEPNANGEWRYIEEQDVIQYYDDTITASDQVMEAGVDTATYFDDMLENASMELNNMLSKRFPVPIQKAVQFDYDTEDIGVQVTSQYDAIIIKATCYLCVSDLLRTNNRQEEADYYYSLVTNTEETGITDRLNKGDFKLSFEVDSNDSQGKIKEITSVGTMKIAEVGGAYVGYPYELLEIECTTGGAYGTAIIKVLYYGSDKLLGDEKTGITVTGQLQEIHGGWYCRFSGASMADGDKWHIDLYSDTRKISNSDLVNVDLYR